MNYHVWTSAEEAVIIESRKNGQYKGVVRELCNALGVSEGQLKNHVRQMKKGGRI